eukprot:scaffold237666_cov33-Tisochrysis_lutea.AAC.6
MAPSRRTARRCSCSPCGAQRGAQALEERLGGRYGPLHAEAGDGGGEDGELYSLLAEDWEGERARVVRADGRWNALAQRDAGEQQRGRR